MSHRSGARHVPGFGARLRRRMARRGLSPESLAYLTCLSPTTISRALNQDIVTERTERRIGRTLSELQRHGRPWAERRGAIRRTTFGSGA